MVRSDNAADGRWVAEPEGTRIFCPLASSFRLHDPSLSGSRSPSFLASSQNSVRRGLDSFPSRLKGRKIDTTIAPASGIGGTTSQSFQYDGLNRPTLNQDITGGGTVLVTFFYDSLGRSIEEAPTTLGASRYVTNTAFTSVPATQFEYPNDRLVDSNYDVLYRRKQIIEQATSVVIASWQYFGPGPNCHGNAGQQLGVLQYEQCPESIRDSIRPAHTRLGQYRYRPARLRRRGAHDRQAILQWSQRRRGLHECL